MPEFSACYFCGTALDAPLAEYPVVPDALHPTADQQRTVVLCPSCRRKLGAVVDAVVAAVDDAPDADSVQRELDAASGNGSAGTTGGDVSAERLDTAADATGVGTPDASAEKSDDPAADEDATPASSEDSGFEFGGDDSSSDDDTAPEEPDGSLDDADAPVEDVDGPSESAPDSKADATAGGDVETDDVAASDEDTDEEPQMTALEYNKVMRLLQNREFPVDKEEFKVVATNAYELGDDEFEAVIEAAEKRDLIGVEGGKIVEG